MINAVIVGAGGYAGAELVSILLDHPSVKITGLFASARREKGDQPASTLADLFPRFRGRLDLAVEATSIERVAALRPDVVFLATPHEASLELAGPLLRTCQAVIDLSAAFRLHDLSAYPTYYGFEHDEPELLKVAAYGMPERFRAAIAKADLIAAPGCYPTASILALAPLREHGALTSDRPIIDAISGVSGAGRGAAQRLLFCEVSAQAYGVLTHRHTPEIAEYVGAPVVFTPHLGPFDRGILATIHAQLAAGWTEDRCRDLLTHVYAAEPFVRVLPRGTWPAVADVRNTNFCDVQLAADATGHLVMSSAIDNLVKGASGQAVQCMNIRFGFDEKLGLGAGESGS